MTISQTLEFREKNKTEHLKQNLRLRKEKKTLSKIKRRMMNRGIKYVTYSILIMKELKYNKRIR